MNPIQQVYQECGLRGVYVRCTIDAFQSADQSNWKSALFASRIVGNYDRGATLGLADDAGVSTDTIEDRAHAYILFEELCKLEGGKFRLFIFQARRLPYVYINHFRVLYDQRLARQLNDHQVLDLLMDIVQAEGDLSTRKLDSHINDRYGDTRPWTYYIDRAMREISKSMQHTETPKSVRKRLLRTYRWLETRKPKGR